jgi:hypothetical protein
MALGSFFLVQEPQIAYWSSMVRDRITTLWHWSARWDWFAALLLGAIGFISVREFGVGIILMALSMLSLTSKLWHANTSTALKTLGTFLIMVFMGLFVVGTVANMEEKPWSNVPVFWNKYGVIRAFPRERYPRVLLYVPTEIWVDEQRFDTTVPIPLEVPRKPEIDLIFKDAPEFTKERKEKITGWLSDYKNFLVKVGFVIPGRLGAVGVTASGGFFGVAPLTDTYATTWSLAANTLDDRELVTTGFSFYLFNQFILVSKDLRDPHGAVFQIWSAKVFSDYFSSVYFNKPRFSGDAKVMSVERVLWNLRQERGGDFVDKAMFYTRERWYWRNPGESGDFGEFFVPRFLSGVNVRAILCKSKIK